MCCSRNAIFGVVGAILLLASFTAPACKRATLGSEDGGGGQGAGGSVAGGSGLGGSGAGGNGSGGNGTGGSSAGGQGGVATGGRGGTVAPRDAAAGASGRDGGADGARDALVEVAPPPGYIPCGASACDPAGEYCKHDVGGLTNGLRGCYTLPAGCAPGGSDCACLLNDATWFCLACRAVTGSGVMGLEIDCPGPID